MDLGIFQKHNFDVCSEKVLFKGDYEIDQIFKIFKLLGTPNEDNWPGISKYSYFKPTFPIWLVSDPDFEPFITLTAAKDLLCKLLFYDPKKLWSCKMALHHFYFVGHLLKQYRFFLLIFFSLTIIKIFIR